MKKILALLVLLALLLPATAEIETEGTAGYIINAVPEPGYGCEWSALGLWGCGRLTQEWAGAYLDSLEQTLADAEGDLGRKCTEYSRVALALTVMGEDPRDFRGYDLLGPLEDLDSVTRQGLSGAVFAFLAFRNQDDAANAAECRELLDYILSRQLTDGGFAITGDRADADVTAMVVCALAKCDGEHERNAMLDALDCLSAMQLEDGGFASYGTPNAESCAQVILALTSAGMALDDPRFVKNDGAVLNAMERFRLADGSYCHVLDGEASWMATQQALLAKAAILRAEKGLSGIYEFEEELIVE